MPTLADPRPPTVEMFCAPSSEAIRLRRWLGPLVAPGPDGDRPGWRLLRHLMVAPFTQLTVVSFDLQMFLFDVFHSSTVARVGHGVGMAGVTLFGVALVACWSPAGAVVVTLLLLAWYGAVAAEARLAGWWTVMVGVMVLLTGLAQLLAWSAAPAHLVAGLLASGAVISLSHAFETHFPPRAGDPMRWLTFPAYLLGPAGHRHARVVTLGRLARVGAYGLVGWVNELWAAPRLLPYNVLRVMFSLGYAPAVHALLRDRAQRAWASGNPAIDFVGIGGGAFLPAEPE